MTYIEPSKISTPKTPVSEFSSDAAHSFVDFIHNSRIRKSPRGDLIALYRTLIAARAFPRIASWSDLYRFMTVRHAPAETINEARALWREFQKSQSADPPGLSPMALRASETGRADHG